MTQTLISLLTLPLKLEHIQHMNPIWKIQENEKKKKKLEKHTPTLPLKLEQVEVHNTNNKIIK
jgi:hypothetical protein